MLVSHQPISSTSISSAVSPPHTVRFLFTVPSAAVAAGSRRHNSPHRGRQSSPRSGKVGSRSRRKMLSYPSSPTRKRKTVVNSSDDDNHSPAESSPQRKKQCVSNSDHNSDGDEQNSDNDSSDSSEDNPDLDEKTRHEQTKLRKIHRKLNKLLDKQAHKNQLSIRFWGTQSHLLSRKTILSPYLALGQWVARWVDPFVSIEAVLNYALGQNGIKGLTDEDLIASDDDNDEL